MRPGSTGSRGLRGTVLTSILALVILTAPSIALAVIHDEATAEVRRGHVSVAARWEAARLDVLAEIRRRRGSGWAGSYYAGDGLGGNVSLDLANDAGATLLVGGCTGILQRALGSVTSDGDVLVLRLTDSLGSSARETTWRLRPVRWGDRQYLLEEDEIVAFVDAIRSGTEPRSRIQGHHLLRDGDQDLPAHGLPGLRAEELARLAGPEVSPSRSRRGVRGVPLGR